MSFELFPIDIFPHGSLRESVVTTVWIGVFVVSFFNLRFGWSYSGLVVPGYLVPLLLNKPIAAGVVVFEGVLTYLFVWFLSEQVSRSGLWSNFFGRDRFFALFLGSVVIRLAFDGWILPEVGNYLVEEVGFRVDYRSDLHSFGTIVVALIANCFWKTGIAKGFVPFTINLTVTYALTRYVLMEFTNFNIGSLFYLYEDIALSFYASPKAYMILLVTAYIASRVNLKFGWDFNGILLPALLALQWYQPMKILTSLVEAVIIVALVHGFLSLPVVKETSYEGARKMLLFFNVSYLYKFLLGYLAVWFFPQEHITDYYGFGYLLPSLLAIKIYDKHIPIRLAAATVLTSFSGVAVATVLGFMLTLAPDPLALGGRVGDSAEEIPPLRETEQSLVATAQQAKLRVFEKMERGTYEPPHGSELSRFRAALRLLKQFQLSGEEATLREARRYLRSINVDVLFLGQKYLLVKEIGTNRGWGTFVLKRSLIDSNGQPGLLLEVPEPLREWNVVEAATVLLEELNGEALAIAGAGLETNADQSSNILTQRGSIFYEFHRAFSDHNVLQVRGYSRTALRKMFGIRGGESSDNKSSLWVRSQFPAGLNLRRLKELVGSYDVFWKDDPEKNVLREHTNRGFASLWLSRSDRKELLFKPLLEASKVKPEVFEVRIVGYLQEWLLGTKREIAPRGSGEYQPPSKRELLYLEEEVLVPLLRLLREDFSEGGLSETGERELSAINLAAGALQYSVRWYRHERTEENYLILSEGGKKNTRRYWGTYVFRVRPKSPFLIQVPRPLNDKNSFEVGVALFEDTEAEALLISGAHRFANTNTSADLLYFENRENLFNLVSQVTLREAGERPQLVLHSRAFRYEPDHMPEADILVSTSRGLPLNGQRSELVTKLTEVFKRNNLSYTFHAGKQSSAGYEASSLVQSRYLDQLRNKELAVLWLSPLLRSSYQQQDDNRRQAAHFESLELISQEADLFELLEALTDYPQPRLGRESEKLVEHYLESGDISALAQLKNKYGAGSLRRVIDQHSKQAFLLLSPAEKTFPYIINLNPRSTASEKLLLSPDIMDVEQIQRFILSGVTWLQKKESK